MARPTVAVVGASANRLKFGNRAVRAYAQRGYEVFPIHPTAAAIEGHRAYRSVRELPVGKLDRITLYLPPEVGLKVLDDLASKPAADVWLNPGTESPGLLARARELGLPVVQGCSIVAIGVDPHLLAEE
jgi:predicted CoA-binding protein